MPAATTSDVLSAVLLIDHKAFQWRTSLGCHAHADSGRDLGWPFRRGERRTAEVGENFGKPCPGEADGAPHFETSGAAPLQQAHHFEVPAQDGSFEGS